MTEKPIPPGSTIGILGGGQLGRMLAVAAARLGLHCHIYADAEGSPAFEVARTHTVAPYNDLDAVAAFAKSVDVVTYEFENIPRETAEAALAHTALHPSLKALETSQDRIAEKAFLSALDIPVAPYAEIPDGTAPDGPGVDRLSYPALLKTSRFGYDGKGQVRVANAGELSAARRQIDNIPAVLEQMIAFEREVSIIAVRGTSGDVVTYDIVENVHENQILKTSTVPASIDRTTEELAGNIAGRILHALGYVGVLAVELFHCPDNPDTPLLVNEIAPRVHNSGHWTLDACTVCQFENHIRAIAGWPLGTTARNTDAVMTNLIGDDVHTWENAAREPATAIHLYGKAEARPGRKMGHVTRLSPKRP
ncbi:MAG: 5-(carboxyamino)imidazole ribonucleotide synthase [Hyphomicrobiaceae bacterium]